MKTKRSEREERRNFPNRHKGEFKIYNDIYKIYNLYPTLLKGAFRLWVCKYTHVTLTHIVAKFNLARGVGGGEGGRNCRQTNW